MSLSPSASLLSLKNPEGNRRFHAHLFALSDAASPAAVSVGESGRAPVVTRPLERQRAKNTPSTMKSTKFARVRGLLVRQ